jgi:hypothetical protein
MSGSTVSVESLERAFAECDRSPRATPEPDPSLAAPIDPSVGLPVLHGVPDAEVVRATLTAHGSVLVRELLPRALAESLRADVAEAIAARDAFLAGAPLPGGEEWYSELPTLRMPGLRPFVTGVLAVDSPRGFARYLDALEQTGIDRLAAGFLGGPPALSAEKTIFRCVSAREVLPPEYGWHQDGAFLGERIRALDVWIALTPCGRDAPSLEVLPRRVDRILPKGAIFDWDLSKQLIENEYPGFTTASPEFLPGDALLIDQLCVHRACASPEMTVPRLSIECWMFAPESVPADYQGLML